MITHFQRHVHNCSLCRRKKLVADKYQLQITEVHFRSFAKVSVELIVKKHFTLNAFILQNIKCFSLNTSI